MPTRRRRNHHSSAAALPHSRLPIGTPLFASSTPPDIRQQQIVQTTEDWKDNHYTGTPSPTVPHLSPAPGGTSNNDCNTSSSSESFNSFPSHSQKFGGLRSFNLLRSSKTDSQPTHDQYKRHTSTSGTMGDQIPSLNSPIASSKGKGKAALHPLDSSHNPASFANWPQTDTPSSPRPVSRISSRNSTKPFNTKMGSFAFPESGLAFQGRRNRKGGAALSNLEDKSRDRQTTVEASFNKREINDVFGNDLPSPDYILSTLGTKDGQIQFVQHPNGDIAAHQWSASRFTWENIKQFSNIRKRVEGQLAADRLKGETADQALQLNTLAYFRTIAKQREAQCMGEPFGAKEIQALMPGRSSSGKDEPLNPLPHQPKSPVKQSDASLEQSYLFNKDRPFEDGIGQQKNALVRVGDGLSTPGMDRGQTTFGVIEGPLNPRNHEFRTPLQPQQLWSVAQNSAQAWYPDIGSFTHGAAPGRQQLQPWSSTYSTQPALTTQLDWLQGQQYGQTIRQHTACYCHACIWHRNYAGIYGQAYLNQGSPVETKAQPYGLATVANKTAIKDTKSRFDLKQDIIKSVENAKERSLTISNQGKYRSVLRDDARQPDRQSTFNNLQDEDEMDFDALNKEIMSFGSKQLVSPLGNLGVAKTYHPLTPEKSTATASPLSEIVRDSEPDHGARRCRPVSYGSSHPLCVPNFWQNNIMQGDVPPRDAVPPSNGPYRGSNDYEKDLDDWFTSRSRFQRQEDFCQRVLATDKNWMIPATPTPTQSRALKYNPTTTGPKGTDTFNLVPTPLSIDKGEAEVQDPIPATVELTSRALITLYENLASYTEGPAHKRRDYWSAWPKADESLIDRTPGGRKSFYREDVMQAPPIGQGRSLVFGMRQPQIAPSLTFGSFNSAYSSNASNPGARFGSIGSRDGTNGIFGGSARASSSSDSGGGSSGGLSLPKSRFDPYGIGRY
ncbi:hypothetical protein K431DRAFT_325167 [Polychaeton citri CBS 116435]|uniref:Uncharacterized protein n=1 Tax=Polychaeton citri CBS 116435 TaxID=1314669 RepID=A0A9P4QC45_9PEZI|nr:hypothetical protein K431DRAFT_325167 [Polychaeton citri CBS 116435]